MIEPMAPEFVKWLVTLGVGGVLAGFMFMFYRKDIKQYTELWKTATDMLMLTVKENTASNTKLISMLESMERSAIRRSDIEEFVNKKLNEDKR